MAGRDKITVDAAQAADLLEAEKASKYSKENPNWWRDILKFNFQWREVNSAGGSTSWATLRWRTPGTGATGAWTIKAFGERQAAGIIPMLEEDLQELVSRRKNLPDSTPPSKRDREPNLQVTLYEGKIEVDSDGKATISEGTKRSNLYRVLALRDEAFRWEIAQRIENGVALKAWLGSQPAERLASADLKDLIAEFMVGRPTPHQGPGDIIIGGDSPLLEFVNENFPPKQSEKLSQLVTIAPNIKVTSLVQTRFSMTNKSQKLRGKPLPNPIGRLKLPVDRQSGLLKTKFFDKSKPFTQDGLQRFEQATPSNEKIHKFITLGSTFDAIIGLDRMCISNMGISAPPDVQMVVTAPVEYTSEMTLDDLYGDDGAITVVDRPAEVGGSASGSGTAPDSATVATDGGMASGSAPPAATDESDYSSMIDELTL